MWLAARMPSSSAEPAARAASTYRLLCTDGPGASLGGAVAMDYALAHPESVESLILLDAGGESYAQPDPFLTALAVTRWVVRVG